MSRDIARFKLWLSERDGADKACTGVKSSQPSRRFDQIEGPGKRSNEICSILDRERGRWAHEIRRDDGNETGEQATQQSSARGSL